MPSPEQNDRIEVIIREGLQSGQITIADVNSTRLKLQNLVALAENNDPQAQADARDLRIPFALAPAPTPEVTTGGGKTWAPPWEPGALYRTPIIGNILTGIENWRNQPSAGGVSGVGAQITAEQPPALPKTQIDPNTGREWQWQKDPLYPDDPTKGEWKLLPALAGKTTLSPTQAADIIEQKIRLWESGIGRKATPAERQWFYSQGFEGADMPTSLAGGIPNSLEAIEYAYQNNLIDEPTRRQMIAQVLAKAGGAPGGSGMTEYQRAELGLSQQRFGLEQLQTQIQAARTGNPLAYLSLIRGAPVSYAGLTQAVPTLASAGGYPAQPVPAAVPGGGITTSAGGAGVAQTSYGGGRGEVPMPPFMKTISEGAPLGQPQLPSGVFTPGVQAQSRMTPYEQLTDLERAETQGVPGMDYQWYLDKIRQSVGPGLRPASYGGFGVAR